MISECYNSFFSGSACFLKLAPPWNLRICVIYYEKHESFGKEFRLAKFIAVERVTPVAGLFLTRLGFENIFKTQSVFKIKELFQVMLEELKYFRKKGSTLLGSKTPRNFPKKSREFFGALSGGCKRGFTFHGSFSKRAVQICQSRRFHRTEEFSNNFSISWQTNLISFRYFEKVIASKADRRVLKTHCVLKIFSKPRRVSNSPATGICGLLFDQEVFLEEKVFVPQTVLWYKFLVHKAGKTKKERKREKIASP